MIAIHLEPCCKNCHYSDIAVDRENLYSFNDIYDVAVVISCRNEHVCRFRKDASKHIKPMKWGDDEHQGSEGLV